MEYAPEAPLMKADRNTFAHRPGSYARARPTYPADLFRWIAGRCEDRRRAWDCATGNGQAAVSLAGCFDRVDATDVSAEQIAHGFPHARVRYAVAGAEASGLPGGEYDLVTVAQALHWFRLGPFWAEVRRVAKPNALFCAWGYDRLESTPVVEREFVAPFRAILDPFWAPNNGLLRDGYRPEEVGFPFDRVDAPPFAIEVRWTLGQLADYMMTWSAYKRSRADAGARTSVDAMLKRVRVLIPADEVIQVRMPLTVLVGRVA
jgi:hypothetical protein